MSRRSPRYKARFTATVEIEGVEHTLVCRTRNISIDGCFLDTAESIAEGARLTLAITDNESHDVVEVDGIVARRPTESEGRGIGVLIPEPSIEWETMVDRHRSRAETEDGQRYVRLSVLVVGDETNRRDALALYVTSGWDIRFAIDLQGAEEALREIKIDAVIAEREEYDEAWTPILEAARRIQPNARRIVRCGLDGMASPPRGADTDLVHSVVDLDSGLDAVVDALMSQSSLAELL